MPDAVPEIGGVPFDEAIDFLKQKVRLPTRRWTDLWEGQHARAFVVAGAVQDDILADFQTSLLKSIESGGTKEQWRDEFERIAQSWTGDWRGKGTERGRAWRSSVIWDTNCRMAYAAGQWKQIQQAKEGRPYLLYSAVLDSRTRPDHARWNGTILPVDDPWWHTHYPPNGWYCRCQVIQLSQRDLDRRGWQVSEPPTVQMVSRSIRVRGEPVAIQVPDGIDPGFGHNIGIAGWGRDAQALRMRAEPEAMRPLIAPGGNRPADPEPLEPMAAGVALGRRADSEVELRAALRAAIGGDEAVFSDPLGGRVLITQALVDHMLELGRRTDGREQYFPLIPQLISGPQEVWVGFAEGAESGRVAIRRRYVSLLRVGKTRVIGLAADVAEGQWLAATFFRGEQSGLKNLRTGLRIWPLP